MAKFRVLKTKIASGDLPVASGNCALCNDAASPLEYHDEDYGEPYLWAEPAIYALCKTCHVHKLHQRFNRPAAWTAFLVHVRRGGYARDLKDPAIKKEVSLCQSAIKRQMPHSLKQLRSYDRVVGAEWFAKLRMDAASLTDHAARPVR